ncbi:MAG: hypothetical protein SGI72_01460 [Planctomycetota bacterium]|nr:hypothetical protein [Planctomycetota bacterium]
MDGSQAERSLKRDVFGSVERLGDALVRRNASGSWVPLSGVLSRRLLRRERKALERLDGLSGVPRLVPFQASSALAAVPGVITCAAGASAKTASVTDLRSSLVRTFIEGAPLSEAAALPANFFDELDALVVAVHARGVCHNDLHKEQNVIVAADGYPWLVDFQLASVHESGSSQLARRAREDLRHVEKHRRRYTRDGRGPNGVQSFGRGSGRRRSPLALAWRRAGKPVYNLLAELLAPRRAKEPRRSSSGPWPVWAPPVPPRSFT